MLLLFALIVGSMSAWADTTYKLTQVTSVEDGGLYVFEQDGYVMNNTINNSALQTTNSYNTTGLTGTETYVWKLVQSGSTDNFYMLNVKVDKYLANASSTTVTFEGTAPSKSGVWAFKFQDDETVLIQNTENGNRFLGYTNSTSHAYKAYATSNLSSYAHAIKVYKLEEETGGGETPAPSISANNVDIAFDATEGSIAYTISNGVDGGSISAEVTNGDWLTLGQGTTSPISFTCSANETTTARTATVTLTYAYGDNETVTKDVTITQAAAAEVYSTIPALFAAATSTATDVNVTFNNWVVSGVSTNGKNVFVTDGTNGFVIYSSSDQSSTYAVGDILSGTAVACSLKLNSGYAQVTNLNASDLTITDGGIVSAANIEMANLAGVNTGALVSYTGLTCSVSSGKYYLSDGTTTIQLYTSLYAFGALTAGKTYNITGIYQQYNTTKEILPRSAADIEEVVVVIPSITVNPNTIDAPAAGADGKLTVTYNNFTTVLADVEFCDANGEAVDAATYSWVTAKIDEENNVDYVIEVNVGEARTAYMKVWAYDDDSKPVYSELITITQAKMTVDYATLPFSYDGNGQGDLPDGLTQNGVASYSSSPKMKFDSTDDYLVLHFNERPGKLTFDIKGNTFSGGTFTVQTSEDGVTYSDLETYTDLGSTQSEEFDDLGENVRYIKWIYTEKVNGNVALGNIALAQYGNVPAVPSITVDNYDIDAPAEGVDEGTLTVTYNNITDVAAEVYFCDANGEAVDAATYDWFYAEINDENNVDYVIVANDGEARTAYMKVWAYDDEMNEVYSDMITITQAAYVDPAVVEKYELYSGKLVEGDYIIYYDGGYAMKNTEESSRLSYDLVTLENDVITTSNASIVWHIAPSGEYWTIYNEEADAYAASTGTKNKAQMLADGTDDKALWTVSGTTAYEFINKANAAANVNCNLRNNGTYGFACYATTTGGALSLYKKLAAKLNSEGYATFSSTLPIDFSQATDYTAWIVSEISGTTIKFQQVTGEVAAGTGVLLKGEAGETVYPVAASEGTTLSDNLLVGITSATEVTANQFFGLSGKKFVPVNAGTIPAGKALLPASEVPSEARQLTFVFGSETTGIAEIQTKNNVENGAVYNLSGQRVAQPTKGLYIVNGKKYVVK